MLTEDDVIDDVRDHLVGRGWAISQRATARQRGEDLIAERDGRRLIVEAKGAGSSKEGSRRYGSEYNSAQVSVHVAKAVLTALGVVSTGNALAAIALPDNRLHRKEVEKVALALRQVNVGVFWVTDDRAVALDASWSA